MIGTIIKAYGGFYFVATEKGVIECRLRGKLKKGRIEPLVGDKVEVDPAGAIEKILTRKETVLLRPKIANVNQTVLVFSVKKPDLELPLLDRFILLSEVAGIEPVICLNKKDLLPKAEKQPLPGSIWAEIKEIYEKAGYKIVYTSAKTGDGIEDLAKFMEGKISVMAGPSGGGKTSVLNAIEPGLKLKVGELSERAARGKHTTRAVELLQLGRDKNILVADTPGFTALDLTHIYFWRLQDFFPEFQKFVGKCRFGSNCLHEKEPGCKIKEAAEKGAVAKSRYESYLGFLKEIKGKRKYRFEYRRKT